jgi:hypothetical protein
VGKKKVCQSVAPRPARKQTMPPKRRSSPTTNAPSAKKPRAKQKEDEPYEEGDAWLLPALHKHGGEDFKAVANDPAFDGPRRGRTAEELEVALTQWMSRPMSKPSPRKGSPRARTAKKDDNFVALEDSSEDEEPVAKKPKSTPVCSVCKKHVPTEKCAICSKRFSMKCAGRERVPDAGVFECDACEAKNLCHETCGGGKSGNKQADYRCGHCGRRYCDQALRENGQRAPQGDLWRCFRCEASYGLEAIECHDGDWYLCTWKASADWHASRPVWKSSVAANLLPRPSPDLYAIDATPARRRDGVDSSPLDGASTAASSSRNDLVHTTHWLIITQVMGPAEARRGLIEGQAAELREAGPGLRRRPRARRRRLGQRRGRGPGLAARRRHQAKKARGGY